MDTKNYDVEEKEVIHAFYGDKEFVKIKNSLAIGKILFAFADRTDAKDKKIDYYMDAVKCKILCKSVLDFSIGRKIIASKQEQITAKAQYPKEIWDSLSLPANEAKTAFKQFHIGPSTKSEYFGSFRAHQAKVTLRIPIISYDDLLEFAEKANYILDDYCRKTYTVANTTSNYKKNKSNDIDEKNKNHAPSTTGSAESKNLPEPPANNDQNQPVSDIISLKLKNVTPLTSMNNENGDFCLQAYKADGSTVAVIYRKQQIDSINADTWNDFRERTQRGNIQFTINCTSQVDSKGLERLEFVSGL